MPFVANRLVPLIRFRARLASKQRSIDSQSWGQKVPQVPIAIDRRQGNSTPRCHIIMRLDLCTGSSSYTELMHMSYPSVSIDRRIRGACEAMRWTSECIHSEVRASLCEAHAKLVHGLAATAAMFLNRAILEQKSVQKNTSD